MNNTRIGDIILFAIKLFFDLLPFILIIVITILIVKAIRRSNKQNYELRKYQAETERIKAEAMRDKT